MADPVLTKTDRSLKWTLLALVCLLSVYGLSVGFFLNYILSFTCKLSHYYSLTCRYLNVKPDSKLQHAIIHPSKVADIGLHVVFVGLSWIKGTNGRQRTSEIFHVYCIVFSGFMCHTIVIFEIKKDGSLVFNTLAKSNCFIFRNLFKNGANDMSECLTCETAFCKKAQNFV